MGLDRKGKPFSEEHKKNLSKSHLGFKVKRETKDKIRNTLMGRSSTHTSEGDKKISESLKIFYKDLNHIKKQSDTHKGHKATQEQKDNQSKSITEYWATHPEAIEKVREESRIRNSGKNSHFYIDGRTSKYPCFRGWDWLRLSKKFRESEGNFCALFELGDCKGWLVTHHIHKYHEGGSNDLSNLLVLCNRHNILVDRYGLDYLIGNVKMEV
jgi:hypothetical protein